MIFYNIIAVIITLVVQFFHIKTLKDTLRYKNTYLYAFLVKDEKVYRLALNDKKALLKNNQIILIITIIVSVFLIIFNQIPFIIALYLLIFLLLPYVFTHYQAANDIDNLRIANYLDEERTLKTKYFGLVFDEEMDSGFIHYGVRRGAINFGSLKGKIFSSFAIVIIIIILILSLILGFSKSEEAKITSKVTADDVVLKYDIHQDSIPFDEVKSIEKIKTMPEVVDSINGIEKNNYLVGEFNLKGYPKAILYVDTKAVTFLKITTDDHTYFFSDENQANSNTLFDTISRLKHK